LFLCSDCWDIIVDGFSSWVSDRHQEFDSIFLIVDSNCDLNVLYSSACGEWTWCFYTHVKRSKFAVFLGELCTIFGEGVVLVRGCSHWWIYCEGLRYDVVKN
jgi:hypothetical protein